MTEEIQKIIDNSNKLESENVELKSEIGILKTSIGILKTKNIELEAKEPTIIEKIVEKEVEVEKVVEKIVEVENKSDVELKKRLTFLLRITCVNVNPLLIQQSVGKLLDKLGYGEFLPPEIKVFPNIRNSDLEESKEILNNLYRHYKIPRFA